MRNRAFVPLRPDVLLTWLFAFPTLCVARDKQVFARLDMREVTDTDRNNVRSSERILNAR